MMLFPTFLLTEIPTRNLNFVNNRKKIKELKELCASGKQKVVSVNWDGGEEYENTCMLGESLLCRRHQHF